MAEDEEEGGLKPRKAAIDDEFLQHPGSGALVRNPLREKAKSQPILFSSSEYDHNCLDETLSEWHCVNVTEASFREMMSCYQESRGSSLPSKWSRSLSQTQRVALGKIHHLQSAYEFAVNLRKSQYVAPRHARRTRMGGKEAQGAGTPVDKVNIEVSDADGTRLRVENITEGLVLAWNRTHPSFPVRIGDYITRVNDRRLNASLMLEEMVSALDVLRLQVQRAPPERRTSAELRMRGSITGSMDVDATLLPEVADMKGSLANPEKRGAADRRASQTRKRPSVLDGAGH